MIACDFSASDGTGGILVNIDTATLFRFSTCDRSATLAAAVTNRQGNSFEYFYDMAITRVSVQCMTGKVQCNLINAFKLYTTLFFPNQSDL